MVLAKIVFRHKQGKWVSMIRKPVVTSKIDAVYCGRHILLEFTDNMTVVGGNSGVGKTRLWELLHDLVLDFSYLSMLSWRNKNDDILKLLKSSSGKLFVIDNADVILGTEERRYIAFDGSNQYLLFGRNPENLMLTYSNLREIVWGSDFVQFEEV